MSWSICYHGLALWSVKWYSFSQFRKLQGPRPKSRIWQRPASRFVNAVSSCGKEQRKKQSIFSIFSCKAINPFMKDKAISIINFWWWFSDLAILAATAHYHKRGACKKQNSKSQGCTLKSGCQSGWVVWRALCGQAVNFSSPHKLRKEEVAPLIEC